MLGFCSECLDENTFKFACPGWGEWELPLNNRAIPNALTPTVQILQNIDDDETRERSQVPESVVNEDILMRPVVDDHVAVVYEGDGEWYIGKVQVVDEDEEEAKVSFMEFQGQDQYQWPLKPDIVWIPFKNVPCKIKKKTVATGTSMRFSSSIS